MLNQHTRAAFSGGMDGNALVPTPVGASSTQSVAGQGGGSEILFYQDTLVGNGSSRTFSLAFLPMTNSERVFMNGLYHLKGQYAAWTRSGKEIIFSTAPLINAKVVVEYAYPK